MRKIILFSALAVIIAFLGIISFTDLLGNIFGKSVEIIVLVIIALFLSFLLWKNNKAIEKDTSNKIEDK